MAGFLDPTYESELTGLPANHGTQTLAFIKNILKGILYTSLSVSTRTVTGQVKYGDGTNKAAVTSINIQCDQIITVNTGTLVTTGAGSIQLNTNSSGVFQVTIAGTQGASVIVSTTGGVSQMVLVGSGGAGGGGGGGISGITVKDEGSTVTGGPHTALDFVGAGVSVANAGGGQATVTIAGGGGISDWTAGTYAANSQVIRGPYIWKANNSTNEDPFLVEGNLGAIADWVPRTGGTPGMVQTPGSSDGAPNGKILLINNFTGSSAAAYRQSVNSGVLGKMLVIDAQISGTADWLYFGFFDSTAVQTASDLLSVPGNTFYGLNIFIYAPSTAKIENIINGSVGTNVAYSNANSTNAGLAFSRWYLKTFQNGSNWDIELWRDASVAGTTAYTAFSPNQVDALALVARFTNVARPSYTNWRFVVGARTGGSAGIFSVRAAYVRNLISGNWSVVAPLQNGF